VVVFFIVLYDRGMDVLFRAVDMGLAFASFRFLPACSE
jgi:hypothetical protein